MSKIKYPKLSLGVLQISIQNTPAFKAHSVLPALNQFKTLNYKR